MADKIEADALVWQLFILTMIGAVAFIGSILLFIL